MNIFFYSIFFKNNNSQGSMSGAMTAIVLVSFLMNSSDIKAQNAKTEIPHLRQQGTASQLIVQGKPFLILGGELGNSTASNPSSMNPFWINFKKMNLNTILAPVYWELMEPQEGLYDFSLVDSLVVNARRHNLKLVLLWFGTWKNSMSCYVPYWIKNEFERFPRAKDKNNNAMEILTAFSRTNLEADKKAFTKLMKHLRDFDEHQQTVLMIQVENEVGMIPDARDFFPKATELFKSDVPEKLMHYLFKNKNNLAPGFKAFWIGSSARSTGTWEEIFGKGVTTDEVFMAWHFSEYINEIAAAGKTEYPLPMFVNAALIREGSIPGQYPSGGPLPHLIDIWKAGAPSIDILSPDIYFGNFSDWCQQYSKSGNPLFIPEALASHQCASNVFYAFGLDAIGFCPFSIESIDPEIHRLTQSYALLSQLMPLILNYQGKGIMKGVLLDKDHPEEKIAMGKYILRITFELNDQYAAQPQEKDPRAGGLIIQTGPDEYLVAGSGLIVTFETQKPNLLTAGIMSIDEGKYINGEWVPRKRLNGDQSHQGRHMRLPYMDAEIQRVKLYQYK
jgi:beta-galactosidase GanA